MSITNALASVAVKDLSSATKGYERLFGRPASRPMPEVATDPDGNHIAFA